MTTESEQSLKSAIQAKGLNALRLRPEDIDKVIVASQFYVFPGTVTTVCCITLANGFTAVGESAPISPENFDKQIGERRAFEEARRKIWALEGYRMKQDLFRISMISQNVPHRD